VNITNPPTDPFTSTVQTMPVYATVLNVASAQNIQVRRNGNPVNTFSFDPNTHQVTFTANLQNGNNLYEVIGTNSVGSASDAVTIIYNPAPAIQPPVVTIVTPSACPFQTKIQQMTIVANITNVTTASQVSILFNNNPVNIFNFVNQGTYASVSFNVTLNPGLNPFTITGTNAAGSNSKSCEVNYKVTSTTPPPSVTITNPSSNPYTSNTQAMMLNATVLNVNGQNEITVAFNNANVSNFNYNASTHVVTYAASLNNGNNTWTVSAANSNGSDSKSTTIIYNPAPVVVPPVVNITIPATSPYVTNNNQQGVTAQVLNVTAASQIVVRDDLNATVNFNYNPTTHLVTFQPVLRRGPNSFTVTATNSAGTASDNVTIDIQGTPPNNDGRPGGAGDSHSATTTISSQTSNSSTSNSSNNTTRPPGSGNSSTSSSSSSNTTSGNVSISLVNPSSETSNSPDQILGVSMTVAGVSSAADITVTVNGTTLPNGRYTYNNGSLTFNANLVSGANTIVVTAHSGNASAVRTLTVNFNASGRSGQGGGSGKGGSTKATESKSTETKSAETRPAEPKTTETKSTTTPRSSITTPSSTSTPRGGQSSTTTPAASTPR
jgi:hypothetical protein